MLYYNDIKLALKRRFLSEINHILDTITQDFLTRREKLLTYEKTLIYCSMRFMSFINAVFIVLSAYIVTSERAWAELAAPVTVDAKTFIGSEFMQSPYHFVAPNALSNGVMLTYIIETPMECMSITGTEQARTRIKEIHAAAILRRRSTPGAILGAAKDRTTNLIETPYRVSKSIIDKGTKINSVTDAVLFLPEYALHVTTQLIEGVKELTVTGVRVSKGAANTQCSGLGCIEKAGADVWSGVNSLAGKHNASRRIHAEFGTDPDTRFQSYRRQVDRLAYAEGYTSTTIKLGAGNAGIDYLSPAFTNVGYYNNGEFVSYYEDAHRQRNKEKKALISWGASPQTVNNFYKNRIYTKIQKRRMFKALSSLPNEKFRTKLFLEASQVKSRDAALPTLRKHEYFAMLSEQEQIERYISSEFKPMVILKNQTLILPIYADYLTWNKDLKILINKLAKGTRPKSIHVLGYATPEVTRNSQKKGIVIKTIPLGGR